MKEEKLKSEKSVKKLSETIIRSMEGKMVNTMPFSIPAIE